MNAESILTPDEEFKIKEAIVKAELRTSGEIRVHLSDSIEKDPYQAALKIFKRLEMHKTDQRNGVLIHLNMPSKKVTIIGDKGIHEKVKDHFWQDVVDTMVSHFKLGQYLQGFEKGIALVGEKLKAFFPYEDGDINELNNEITKN